MEILDDKLNPPPAMEVDEHVSVKDRESLARLAAISQFVCFN